MILGGRSFKTSSFNRRRRKGKTCLCSASKANAAKGRCFIRRYNRGRLRHIPASLFFDLPSRLDRMGLPNRSLNEDSEPKKPGIRKSNKLQSSKTLFWMGVPES